MSERSAGSNARPTGPETTDKAGAPAAAPGSKQVRGTGRRLVEAVAGPKRERAVTLLALLAAGAMLVTVIFGGPAERDDSLEYSPEIMALLEAEQHTRPSLDDGRQTWATVRLPDRPRYLADYFAAMNYHLAGVREGGPEVPRVFVARLPDGLKGYEPTDARKRLFIRTMLPLVLRANEEVLATRERLVELRGQIGQMESDDRTWLLETAETYRVEAESPDRVDFKTLLTRVDAVPPSLAITQSILESGWGTSRFARQGNALFGQRTWSKDTPGIDPKEAEGFKVRAFDSLLGSVRAYVYNLNTTGAYDALRRQRAQMRAKGRPIDGYQLAGTLLKYSEEGAQYVQKLRSLMGHNGLRAFDDAGLRQQTIAQRVIPDGGVSQIQVALAQE